MRQKGERMANWKQDLERQLDEVVSVQSQAKPRVVRKKTSTTTTNKSFLNKNTSGNDNNYFTLPLVLLICIMSIALVASYNFRKRGEVYASSPASMHQQHFDVRVLQDYQEDARRHQEHLMSQQKGEWESHRRQFEDSAEAAIRETYGRTKVNRERLTLLGILYNNNIAAMRAGTKDYIFINSDWTINRYPNHLNLDTEDRAFLSKFVKSNN